MRWAYGANPGNRGARELEAGLGIGGACLFRLAAHVVLIVDGRPSTLEVDLSIRLLEDDRLAVG